LRLCAFAVDFVFLLPVTSFFLLFYKKHYTFKCKIGHQRIPGGVPASALLLATARQEGGKLIA